jgi:hypothetical protein
MSVTSISLDEEPVEQPVEPKPERAAPAAPSTSEEWKDKLLELLRSMPADTALKLFDRGGLRELLMELAKDDPLLGLCIKVHEAQPATAQPAAGGQR